MGQTHPLAAVAERNTGMRPGQDLEEQAPLTSTETRPVQAIHGAVLPRIREATAILGLIAREAPKLQHLCSCQSSVKNYHTFNFVHLRSNYSAQWRFSLIKRSVKE